MVEVMVILLLLNVIRMIAENTGNDATIEREKPPAILRDTPPTWWNH